MAMDWIPEDGPHTRKLMVRAEGPSGYSALWSSERGFWTRRLLVIAAALDKLYSTGEALGKPQETRILSVAFETFLVLVDPEWWRANPPQQLSAAQERAQPTLAEPK